MNPNQQEFVTVWAMVQDQWNKEVAVRAQQLQIVISQLQTVLFT